MISIKASLYSFITTKKLIDILTAVFLPGNKHPAATEKLVLNQSISAIKSSAD